MQKILFPTDFSENANNALAYALELAKKIKAEIEVIHVYSVSFTDVAPLAHEYIKAMMDSKLEEVDTGFEKLIETYGEDSIAKTKAIYGLFPAVEIMDYAEKNKCDYIIMGTKGRTSQFDKIVGSITSTVVMKAPCPVIAIPESAKFEEIYSIALAASFDDKNDQTIERLQVFANQVMSGIHLVHVNTKSKKEEMEKVMEDEQYTSTFTQFTVVHNPSVINGLDAFVKEYKINMLALYIPKRRLWERIFHQSVTKKMALHSEIPLIVYH